VPENLQRRRVDTYGFDIEHLIAQESDPKQRVFLIVLNNLNISLIANTEATTAIGQKLDAHLTNFERYTQDKERILNQGKGAWKIIAWALSTAQLLIGAGAVWAHNEIVRLNEVDHQLESSLVQLRSQVNKESP
jgi:hypothetical protein